MPVDFDALEISRSKFINPARSASTFTFAPVRLGRNLRAALNAGRSEDAGAGVRMP